MESALWRGESWGQEGDSRLWRSPAGWLGRLGSPRLTGEGLEVEDTRRLLNEKAREGRERAGDAARQGREFVNRQRDTISTAIDRGREAYDRRTAETPVATDEDVSEAPA